MKNDFVCVCVRAWKNNHARLPSVPKTRKLAQNAHEWELKRN